MLFIYLWNVTGAFISPNGQISYSKRPNHVAEEHGLDLVGDHLEPGVVPVPGVRAAAADDELGAEIHGLLLQLLVVDIASGDAHLVPYNKLSK